MTTLDVRIFFIKDFPISELTCKLEPGMGPKEYAHLLESIKKEGIRNPLIVEKEPEHDGNTYYRTVRNRGRYVVQVGHNRVCALLQLGHTTADIIVACKERLKGEEIALSRVLANYRPIL